MYTFQTDDWVIPLKQYEESFVAIEASLADETVKESHFLWKYTYSLSDAGVADRAFGLVPLTDTIGTFHTEEVVPTGDQGSDDLALKAHRTVAAAFSAGARWGGGGGRGGGRRGRGVAWNPGEVRARQGGDSAGVTSETERASAWVTTHPPG